MGEPLDIRPQRNMRNLCAAARCDSAPTEPEHRFTLKLPDSDDAQVVACCRFCAYHHAEMSLAFTDMREYTISTSINGAEA